jgi:hypothetical protein
LERLAPAEVIEVGATNALPSFFARLLMVQQYG